MATWQEIGQDNFRAAVTLYDGGFYRNATSRFYYAAFSALTHKLTRRGARPAFRDTRATPGHAQLPRLAADYSLIRVDKQSCRDSYLAAKKIFNYLGVPI